MPDKQLQSETKSAELQAFSHWLRTGWRLPLSAFESDSEQKFNPNHDPTNGQFASGPGDTGSAGMGRIPAGGIPGRQQRPGTIGRGASKPSPAPTPTLQRNQDIGSLSARYESTAGGDPGEISSGRNDPGGVSYGTHQLASRTGMVDAFIASPMASRWATRFRNLRPATPAFDAQWRAVAAAEPEAFGAAQKSFLGSQNYSRAVNGVARDTGVNLNGTANAVRQVTWSVAMQHGRARDILTPAVRRTDRSFRRNDPRYQRALINNIYDERIKYTERERLRQLAMGKAGNAKGLENAIKNRFPREHADALNLLDSR